MRSGITRQALRRHRWALAGPACTQALGAAVIAVMLMTATTLKAPGLTAGQREAIAAGQVADTAAVFLGVAIYLSVLVVGVTMNLAVSRQVRDLALLRTIGATPGQIRRSVVLQAALVSLPASLVGCLLAVPLGFGWLALLQAHDVLPAGVAFTPTPSALPAALGIQLATSVAGAWTAGRRTARLAPAIALTESTAGRRRLARSRVALGLLLLAGGLVGSAVVATLAADQAADAAFFVLLAECIGAGLVGPVVLRAVAGTLRPVFPDGLPRLALDGVASLSRPLSGALVPLVLAIAFAAIKVASHTTAAAVTGRPDPAADVWTDYCGTAVYCAFAGIAALNALVTVLVGRRGDLAVLQLAGGSRRRVVLLVAGEAVLITAAAVLLAGVAAGATLLPMLHTSLGTWLPRVPVPALGAGLALTAGLVVAGTVLPAAVLTRQPPLERWGRAG
jgi:putative ABC transport system permease protein